MVCDHATLDSFVFTHADVGNRSPLWALAKNYEQKDFVYSGPLNKSMKVEGDKIRISFAHVGVGLKLRDGEELTEFQIAGEVENKNAACRFRQTALNFEQLLCDRFLH